MKGDFTRFSFDPAKHYSGVRMQQGRVQLDADWNEQQSITPAEKLGACLLMFATLAVGVYPKLLLDRIMPAVETMRFLKSGG